MAHPDIGMKLLRSVAEDLIDDCHKVFSRVIRFLSKLMNFEIDDEKITKYENMLGEFKKEIFYQDYPNFLLLKLVLINYYWKILPFHLLRKIFFLHYFLLLLLNQVLKM